MNPTDQPAREALLERLHQLARENGIEPDSDPVRTLEELARKGIDPRIEQALFEALDVVGAVNDNLPK